jgi:two-component sensor histidine kinase
MSELITNSARHAFGDNGGLIRVELLPSATIIECRVTDNGTSKPRIRPGNGTKIVASLAKASAERSTSALDPEEQPQS